MEPPIENIGLRFGFAAILAVAFFGLYGFAASAPGAMAAPSIGGVPLSLVLASAMILFSVLMTGLYVLITNRTAR